MIAQFEEIPGELSPTFIHFCAVSLERWEWQSELYLFEVQMQLMLLLKHGALFS